MSLFEESLWSSANLEGTDDCRIHVVGMACSIASFIRSIRGENRPRLESCVSTYLQIMGSQLFDFVQKGEEIQLERMVPEEKIEGQA
jgi:hypothetical protein